MECEWTAVEDSKLKDAVRMHGVKDWFAVAARVPGRTKEQCNNRWRDVLDMQFVVFSGKERSKYSFPKKSVEGTGNL
jgi:hypothetical protein